LVGGPLTVSKGKARLQGFKKAPKRCGLTYRSDLNWYSKGVSDRFRPSGRTRGNLVLLRTREVLNRRTPAIVLVL
jgi:hypothetical protein